MKVLYLENNEKKNAGKEQGQDKSKIFVERKQKMNSLKIKDENVK